MILGLPKLLSFFFSLMRGLDVSIFFIEFSLKVLSWAVGFIHFIQHCLNTLFVSRYQESCLILAQDEVLDLLENWDPAQAQMPHHLLGMEPATPLGIWAAQS